MTISLVITPTAADVIAASLINLWSLSPFGIINLGEDCETILSSKVNERTRVRESRAWCTTTD